ncbi:MAG: hypothetical protein JWO48_3647, partial [Bryobacterales bacterium]|nr:hypothetical protein [Bryobacterales bacterium]
ELLIGEPPHPPPIGKAGPMSALSIRTVAGAASTGKQLASCFHGIGLPLRVAARNTRTSSNI